MEVIFRYYRLPTGNDRNIPGVLEDGAESSKKADYEGDKEGRVKLSG